MASRTLGLKLIYSGPDHPLQKDRMARSVCHPTTVTFRASRRRTPQAGRTQTAGRGGMTWRNNLRRPPPASLRGLQPLAQAELAALGIDTTQSAQRLFFSLPPCGCFIFCCPLLLQPTSRKLCSTGRDVARSHASPCRARRLRPSPGIGEIGVMFRGKCNMCRHSTSPWERGRLARIVSMRLAPALP